MVEEAVVDIPVFYWKIAWVINVESASGRVTQATGTSGHRYAAAYCTKHIFFPSIQPVEHTHDIRESTFLTTKHRLLILKLYRCHKGYM